MKKLNLPNKLTVIRLIAVPIFLVVMLVIPDKYWIVRNSVGAFIFIAASITDLFDGKIARKRGLITDFGKFLDPLADKFLVVSAMSAILFLDFYANIKAYFVWVFIVVILREFAITGLRLIIAGKGVVMAAGKLGKLKTTFQMIFIISALVEPILYRIFGVIPGIEGGTNFLALYPPITLISMALTLIFTVWSAVEYFIHGGKYIDPEK